MTPDILLRCLLFALLAVALLLNEILPRKTETEERSENPWREI